VLRNGTVVAHHVITSPRVVLLSPLPPLRGRRHFSRSAPQLKKKTSRKQQQQPFDDDSGGSSSAQKKKSNLAAGTEEVDPFNFADLTEAFDKHAKRNLETLRQTRAGGRSSAEAIGAIPVQPDRKSPQTFPLREVATVAQQGGIGGRRFSILAFDEASVKPIMSAIQSSPDFNQQPQRNEENPLELVMTVEPERAEELQKRVKEVCQEWREQLRKETHKREKLHKTWRSDGLIVADDLVRLKDKMQKLQDERMKVIAQKEKEVLQAVTSRR